MCTRPKNRRQFLGTMASSAAVLGVPWIVPSSVWGKSTPSNTLKLGCVETGRMGHGDMLECLT